MTRTKGQQPGEGEIRSLDRSGGRGRLVSRHTLVRRVGTQTFLSFHFCLQEEKGWQAWEWGCGAGGP